MKIYVHIGTHKTGTKSIQWFLTEHAEQLALEGLLGPKAGTMKQIPGHHRLGRDLVPGPCPDNVVEDGEGMLEALLAELRTSTAHTAVISSERFHHLLDAPENLRAMEEVLRKEGHTLEYLMFARKADGFAKSLYWQLSVRSGMPWSFSRFVVHALVRGRIRWKGYLYHFNLRRYQQVWQAISGFPLHVFSYDEAAAGDGVVPIFLRIVGASETLQAVGRAAKVRNRGKILMAPASQRLASMLLRARFTPPVYAPIPGAAGQDR